MVGANMFAANTSDETAIRAAVMAFQEAWDHHDMKAMGDVFTEDANLINVLGTRWRGRADIVKALGVYHRVMFKNEANTFWGDNDPNGHTGCGSGCTDAQR